jgi:hypothetical protein
MYGIAFPLSPTTVLLAGILTDSVLGVALMEQAFKAITNIMLFPIILYLAVVIVPEKVPVEAVRVGV